MPLLFKITAFLVSLIIGSGFLIQTVFLYKHFNEKEDIAVMPVENRVQIGALAGNRSLEFGVKNILEELISEKGHGLDDNAVSQVKVEILFLDVLKIDSGRNCRRCYLG